MVMVMVYIHFSMCKHSFDVYMIRQVFMMITAVLSSLYFVSYSFKLSFELLGHVFCPLCTERMRNDDIRKRLKQRRVQNI